jgi:hypothetical protein
MELGKLLKETRAEIRAMIVEVQTHSWIYGRFTHVHRIEVMNGEMHLRTETGEFRLPVDFDTIAIPVFTSHENDLYMDGSLVRLRGGFLVRYRDGHVEVCSTDNAGFWGRCKALVACALRGNGNA